MRFVASAAVRVRYSHYSRPARCRPREPESRVPVCSVSAADDTLAATPFWEATVGDSSGTTYRSGILFGFVAYISWGLVPLYFREIKHVPPVEILAHRIVWSMIVLAGLTIGLGIWRDIVRVLRSPRLVATLALSAVLLAGNWLLYIYATVTGRVSEASLGYYMMPLMNAFLATLVFGEKLRLAHYPALALVAIGVAVPFVWEGRFSWLAVVIPLSFACYGLVRKLAPVDSLTGLSVESLLMFLPSVGFLLVQESRNVGVFGPNATENALLMASGIVTVIPLLTFTISIRRMPLLANSFIQFVSPTIQFLIAVFWLQEAMSPDRWVALGFVWSAVAIFLVDAAARLRNKPAPTPIVEVEPESVPAVVGELVPVRG